MFRKIVDAMKEGIGCCSGFNSKGLWVEDGKKYDYGYFDEDNARIAIDRLLSHSYKRNGDGGLFTLKSRTREDMRKTEIWYQMCWYLDEFMDS